MKVKICGITNEHDAIEAARAGADFLGFNFYEKSKRYVFPNDLPPDRIAPAANLRYLAAYGRLHGILDELAAFPRVKKVGVFVNASVQTIRDVVVEFQLDIVQLHDDGTEVFDIGVPVWRAVRLRDEETLIAAIDAERAAAGLVVDAYSPTDFGGTGLTTDWQLIARHRERIPHLILAGGLTPANVRAAIDATHPDVVDTASGVEVNGDARRKDIEKMRAFIAAVKCDA